MTMPAAARRRPWPMTSETMGEESAPSARRMPSSRVRCAAPNPRGRRRCNRRQSERDGAEQRQQERRHSAVFQRPPHPLLHRPDVSDRQLGIDRFTGRTRCRHERQRIDGGLQHEVAARACAKTALVGPWRRTFEVIAATIVTGLCRLPMSFCKIKAGRVLWISAPSAGSNETR